MGAANALESIERKPFATSPHRVAGMRVQLMQLICLPLFNETLGKEKQRRTSVRSEGVR